MPKPDADLTQGIIIGCNPEMEFRAKVFRLVILYLLTTININEWGAILKNEANALCQMLRLLIFGRRHGGHRLFCLASTHNMAASHGYSSE